MNICLWILVSSDSLSCKPPYCGDGPMYDPLEVGSSRCACSACACVRAYNGRTRRRRVVIVYDRRQSLRHEIHGRVWPADAVLQRAWYPVPDFTAAPRCFSTTHTVDPIITTELAPPAGQFWRLTMDVYGMNGTLFSSTWVPWPARDKLRTIKVSFTCRKIWHKMQ